MSRQESDLIRNHGGSPRESLSMNDQEELVRVQDGLIYRATGSDLRVSPVKLMIIPYF